MVSVCVGKMGTGLSQGLAENLRFEGSGVEVHPEGRGESQALAMRKKLTPLSQWWPPCRRHVGGGTSALSPLLLLADDGAGHHWLSPYVLREAAGNDRPYLPAAAVLRR